MIYVLVVKHAKFSHFPAHQLVATKSMLLESTYTTHLLHLSNWRHIWNPVEHLWWSLFEEKAMSLSS